MGRDSYNWLRVKKHLKRWDGGSASRAVVKVENFQSVLTLSLSNVVIVSR